VISAAFLSKCLIGSRFRRNSYTLFRDYFILRIVADAAIILPIVVYYKLRSATYTYNYIIVMLTLTLSEIALLLKNLRHLYRKSIVESIESLQPSQQVDFISHFNTRSRSFVAYINTWKAASFLLK
jgi:predicted nucleic acid-binding protein